VAGERTINVVSLDEDHKLPRVLLIPLMSEVDAASELLRCGIDLLIGLNDRIHEPSPMLVTLATGVEKVLKLSIGLLSFEETERWPSRDVMKNKFHHEIGVMHAQVLDDIERRLASPETRGNAHMHVRQLLDDVRADERLQRIVECLDQYAKGGRFHNLDTLAGSEPSWPAPHKLWDAVVFDLLKSDPELMATLGSRDWKTTGRVATNRVMAVPLVRWWNLIDRTWITKVFGRQAQMWSAELGAKIPKDLLD
jgi:hypothetical protein